MTLEHVVYFMCKFMFNICVFSFLLHIDNLQIKLDMLIVSLN